MGNEYNVIGEHKDDEEHLLVVGDDGQPYDYCLTRESLEPTDIDDNWQIDCQEEATEELPAAPGGEVLD